MLILQRRWSATMDTTVSTSPDHVVSIQASSYQCYCDSNHSAARRMTTRHAGFVLMKDGQLGAGQESRKDSIRFQDRNMYSYGVTRELQLMYRRRSTTVGYRNLVGSAKIVCRV